MVVLMMMMMMVVVVVMMVLVVMFVVVVMVVVVSIMAMGLLKRRKYFRIDLIDCGWRFIEGFFFFFSKLRKTTIRFVIAVCHGIIRLPIYGLL
jgi:hypothetical protein